MVLLLELMTARSPWCLVPTLLLETAIALQILLALGLHLWKQMKVRQQRLQIAPNSPCPGCRYFNCNPYLNCALHPSQALGSQSEFCLDYAPDACRALR